MVPAGRGGPLGNHRRRPLRNVGRGGVGSATLGEELDRGGGRRNLAFCVCVFRPVQPLGASTARLPRVAEDDPVLQHGSSNLWCYGLAPLVVLVCCALLPGHFRGRIWRFLRRKRRKMRPGVSRPTSSAQLGYSGETLS